MSNKTKPNIVVIWAPDIGVGQLGCYSHGRGGSTPNIDRLARDGMMFVNTALEPGGAAAVEFMSGHSTAPGMLARAGAVTSRRRDATLASLLRGRGYATGQFGGLRPDQLEDCLVCLDSFDELVGWPRPAGSTGSVHTSARRVQAAASRAAQPETPWWARFGQRAADPTTPLPADGSELSDEELIASALRFMRQQQALDTPFFVWIRVTHTHSVARRVAPAGSSRAGGVFAHDRNVGDVLDQLDQLGIADDTFVVYTAEETPASEAGDGCDPELQSEIGESLGAAQRRPLLVRWPGRIQGGSACNGVVHWRDWLPTLLAVAGEPGARERAAVASSAAVGASEARVAGTNVLPYLLGRAQARARAGLASFEDAGGPLTLRYDNWEVRRCERRAPRPERVPRPRSRRLGSRERAPSPAPATRGATRRRTSRGAPPHRAGER